MNKLIKTLIVIFMAGSLRTLPAQDPLSLPYQAFIGETRLSKELGLTQEQREKIKDIVFDMEKQAENIRSQVRIKEIELRELLLEENPDLKKVENKIREIGNISIELRILKIREFFKVKEILTDEQWDRLKQILEKRPFIKERLKKRFHKD